MASKAQKKAGFLLPDVVDPQQAICVTFQIPDTPEYRAAVTGHVEQLARYWAWERSGQPGDTRAIEAAQLFKQALFNSLVFDEECLKCATPFWFDADTVDDDDCCPDDDPECDQEQDNNQWLEQAADWIITAFIAATFTPGAAIAYKTVIPRVRLFFRTGDLGAIGEILIDGILWGAIDTFTSGAAEVVSNIIDLEAFRQAHNLGPENIIQIRHGGAGAAAAAAAAAMPAGVFAAQSETSPYRLEVVRGDIRAPVLCDAYDVKPTFEQLNEDYFACYGEYLDTGNESMFDIRVNGCILEKSTDGGASWQPVQDLSACAPDVTPVVFSQADCTLLADGNVIFDASCAAPSEDVDFPPETGGSDGHIKRCDLASYLVDIPLPDLVQQAISAQQNSTDILGLAAAVLGMVAVGILTGGTGVPAFVAGAATYFAAPAAAGLTVATATQQMNINALTAEITAQAWQDVKCVIYCHLKGDGKLTEAMSNEISEAIFDELYGQYPQLATLLSSFFANFTSEARGKMSIYGSLYEGSNCDLCNCGTWIYDTLRNQAWFTEYLTIIRGVWDGAAVRDPDATQTYDKVEILLDISATPARFRYIGVGASRYYVSPDPDFANRWTKIHAFNESTGQWVTTHQHQQQSFAQFQIGPGQPIDLGFYTTKLRIEYEGWGLDDAPWEYTSIGALNIHGEGINIFQLEYDERTGA